ncbi:NUDIX hydrolase [Frankia sp. CNm7]|uniref:NUDIX hydrolase n=1 Tax=Frankia nepalensis TaxID=1836974 RepID=A0A937RR30_9ACTN|nr:NUDIX hydrolase [Frankia nepalensis]MBL7496236.1 NUDIX hydrolase [Frankia nepalensis]MBL7514905.1 NUDIX hydrolase [Frankia nepalensis]MBL7524319.1 NUDIX hydrolase [Frankia nepalensis]MBL7631133.1 NUDIX hydrolase [Frankia nepalensis]
MPLTSPRGVLAASAPTPPAPPRHASTVVLLRDAPGGGVEAYLVERARTMAFAGGVYAFPGGRVDPADGPSGGRAAPLWLGPPLAELMRPLEADPGLAQALVHAAVRETFEECGVLLAEPAGPAGPAPGPADPGWAADRLALERRELGLAELLTRRGLALRADLLAPWARWITPEVEPRRYDTRFFMAALPPGQTPGELSGEADQMVWIRPEEALERHAAGAMGMLPPTAWMLADLLGLASVADVLTTARRREITPVMPKVVIADGAVHFLLPHDPEYALAAPPADPASAAALFAAATAGADHATWPRDAADATAVARER